MKSEYAPEVAWQPACAKLLALSSMAICGLGAGCEDEQAEDEAPVLNADDSEPHAASSRASEQVPALPDVAITDAIQSELLLDRTVDARNVTVSTTHGVVELTGSVPHLLAKRRAALLTAAVKGVRSISNQIVVNPVERPDPDVKRDVTAALQANPASESNEVIVSVDKQVVTLEGTVDSWAEHDLAERLALGVRGVRDVNNEIRIDFGAKRSDSEIARDIESQLRWDALVDAAMIEVEVNEGAVKLSGAVSSLAERTRAKRDAEWVLGVRSVDAQAVDVRWWVSKEDVRRDRYVGTTDEDIKNALERAILLDPRINSGEVTVLVESGAVTLTGEVATAQAKNIATQIARDTTAVVSVSNDLKVQPRQAFPDSRLSERVKAAFERSPIVERYEIGVATSNGIVTLAGYVDSFSEMAEAEDLAAAVPGVLGVVNELEVKIPTPRSRGPYVYPYAPYVDYTERWRSYAPSNPLQTDAEIRQEIRDELFWSPFVDSDAIFVSVDDGVATLSGTADTWRELAVATENAFEGRATQVRNKLVLSN